MLTRLATNVYTLQKALDEVHDLKAQVKAINPGNIIEPYAHDDFRAKYSDHLPVSFKLITGRDSD